jgi:hypothetical protein
MKIFDTILNALWEIAMMILRVVAFSLGVAAGALGALYWLVR